VSPRSPLAGEDVLILIPLSFRLPRYKNAVADKTVLSERLKEEEKEKGKMFTGRRG
jgi:hypothetical protein